MWQSIALILLGFAGGLIVGVLIDKDTFYKVTIGKIKQRGEGNTLESELNVKIPPQNKRDAKKEARQAKRRNKKNT